MIGTSFNERNRPPTFHSKFIDRHWQHVNNGLYLYPPVQLDNMVRMGLLAQASDGNLERTEAMPLEEDYKPVEKQSSGNEQFYHHNTLPRPDVSLSACLMDFGVSEVNPPAAHQRQLLVHNNTKGPLTFVWHQIFSKRSPFKISPTEAQIEADSACEFTVSFNPLHADTSFDVLVDATCFYTDMRNFRFINQYNFTVPWSFAVRLCGHTCGQMLDGTSAEGNTGTIRTNNHHLKPIEMGQVEVGRSGWRTVRINGESEGRLRFRLVGTDGASGENGEESSTNSNANASLECYPTVGTIESQSSKLILLRYTPLKAQESQFKRFFSVNERPLDNVIIITCSTHCNC